ncbi:2-oxo acid dehydrogenase subunit E2 [Cryobacterium melibiosiphilum]|uniref:Dihydrolipoamide acetyltransferase component of pyruvate dehydrogenase complex n=1 Tax=Cryobacterium melibiosiphilum TaxID=995039 RepID=A0A3A5MMZ1_9MICO|nr:2-oxo acid dehydrogenase subunit E2 [Cryobacterium melibiosiphilum]
MTEFPLPDLGEGLTEAQIVSWLVKPGDTIEIDQPVVEVESAKSIVELPSPCAGVVGTVFGAPGQTVQTGQVLLTVLAADAAAWEVGRPGSASGAVLVGYGTVDRARSTRPVAIGRFGPGAQVRVRAAAWAAVHSPVVSPLVRRLASENGFDASDLTGTGPEGLVSRVDVEEHIRQRAHRAQDAAARSDRTEDADAQSDTRGDIRIPITGLRRVAAERLARSRREIPEATIWVDVDATELFVARDRMLAATGERFSVTALIARFVVAGLGRYPLLNASVDTASQEILQHARINLGLAAQTSRGLMVPVVHGAEALSTRQLRDAIAGLVGQAEDGTFAPTALTGGTFTLNNFGALGVDGSAAIINHPEAAILGIGRMMERPWVVNHELAVRTVVELSMVFDHRICDGGTAAGFLTFVAGCIENPVSLLAEL